MASPSFEIESSRLFSESSIWQLNQNYYKLLGIDAWQKNLVPHFMTSNSRVGKTYAQLILGMLRDLSFKKEVQEVVYILELGAGHGRLAFHILKHLEKLSANLNIELPPYCYVISDIAEKSISFYQEHPQFKSFFEQGVLDICYFNATKTETLELQHSKKTIHKKELNQPLIVVANYFFDSIPTDLFHVKDKQVSTCSVSVHSDKDPKEIDEKELINHLELDFKTDKMEMPFYKNPIFNEILEAYKNELEDSYLYFPTSSFHCLNKLQELSKQGAMVLSMDKGFQGIQELQNKKAPELVTHGSFSVWVNYHAFGEYCLKSGGAFMFPSFTSFYSQVVCLMLLSDNEDYKETAASYENNVNQFGPDDFNGIKRLTYANISRMNLKELIALVRLSQYDSTFFVKILPRIKQLIGQISVPERLALEQAVHQVWNMYFTINEPYDLAYEMAGMLYQLGFYRKALTYFGHSSDQYGEKADVYFNQALCHFQLNEDDLFLEVKAVANKRFPNYERLEHLNKLDLSS